MLGCDLSLCCVWGFPPLPWLGPPRMLPVLLPPARFRRGEAQGECEANNPHRCPGMSPESAVGMLRLKSLWGEHRHLDTAVTPTGRVPASGWLTQCAARSLDLLPDTWCGILIAGCFGQRNLLLFPMISSSAADLCDFVKCYTRDVFQYAQGVPLCGRCRALASSVQLLPVLSCFPGFRTAAPSMIPTAPPEHPSYH